MAADRCNATSFAFPLARCELAAGHESRHLALGGEIGWNDTPGLRRGDEHADETTPQTDGRDDT